jgi:hypothetical protein
MADSEKVRLGYETPPEQAWHPAYGPEPFPFFATMMVLVAIAVVLGVAIGIGHWT